MLPFLIMTNLFRYIVSKINNKGPNKGYDIFLVDPNHFEGSKYRDLVETQYTDNIILSFDQVLTHIDYILVNYLQPEAGHAQAEIKSKGSTNFLIDFACAFEGLYYIGIC